MKNEIVMKFRFRYLLVLSIFVFSIFGYSQNQYPTTIGDHVKLFDYSSIEMYADYSINPFWNHGVYFLEYDYPASIWAGIGVSGHIDTKFAIKERIFMTHGLEPWNSVLGINIIPNVFVGIGTLTPSARLEVNSNILNKSGLRFINLTSASPLTSNAKAIGLTSSGEVVTIDIEGGDIGNRVWLTSGNSGTTVSNSIYPNNVNNNFLGIRTTALSNSLTTTPAI